eukprot:m.82963 g.82963  ORF g.82963 m.82963 type:complete len:180 (-) comp25575_c0_seq2:45-584(-)
MAVTNTVTTRQTLLPTRRESVRAVRLNTFLLTSSTLHPTKLNPVTHLPVVDVVVAVAEEKVVVDVAVAKAVVPVEVVVKDVADVDVVKAVADVAAVQFLTNLTSHHCRSLFFKFCDVSVSPSYLISSFFSIRNSPFSLLGMKRNQFEEGKKQSRFLNAHPDLARCLNIVQQNVQTTITR